MKRFAAYLLLILLLPACAGSGAPPPTVVRPTRPALPTRPDATTAPEGTAVIPTTIPVTVAPLPDRAAAAPQFGLNFIRFFWSDAGATDMSVVDTAAPYFEPDWIFADFDALGIDAFRQFIKAGLLWNVVEPQDNQWHFDEADAVIMHAAAQPIVTLFSLQYASPTSPWGSEFQKTMGPEAADYLTTVVQRYAPYVTYWEIGNEMNHWRAFDPGSDNGRQSSRQLSVTPPNGFSPEEQGAFLAEAAAIIRANDPDAVILMPGMGGLDDYTLNTWFAGALAGGGADWFDVVNYHFYPNWEKLAFLHRDLDAFMAAQGLTGKPVWLTETGATADPTLNDRTNYPNSPETQAADVFRRAIQAYGLGDSFVAWHTYIGSPAAPNNLWRLYGLRTDTAEAQPAYYAAQLLTSELLPFASVEPVGGSGQQVYRVDTAVGETKYVAWGSGTFVAPDGVTQMTSVVPDENGALGWTAVAPGETITLTEIPVLLK